MGNQVMMGQYDWAAGPGAVYNMDQWDGYLAGRQRFLGFLGARKPNNPVVITGDIHSSWVHDLKLDFDKPDSATVGTEFITTSISASFPTAFIAPVTAALKDNPHAKYFDGADRGYVRCTVTPGTYTSDFRVVSTITEPTATVKTAASYVVQSGKPGAQQA